MTHQLVFMVWTSLLFSSAQVTVWVVAEDASHVLESNTGWQRRMPWSGSKWNTKVSSLTSPKLLELRSGWIILSFGELSCFGWTIFVFLELETFFFEWLLARILILVHYFTVGSLFIWVDYAKIVKIMLYYLWAEYAEVIVSHYKQKKKKKRKNPVVSSKKKIQYWASFGLSVSCLPLSDHGNCELNGIGWLIEVADYLFDQWAPLVAMENF